MSLDNPNGPIVITSIFKKWKRQANKEIQRDRRVRTLGSRLVALKMEEWSREPNSAGDL